MCSTATLGGWPAVPKAATALAFQIRTTPEFGGDSAVAGVVAIGVITPTSATAEAARSALTLIAVPPAVVLSVPSYEGLLRGPAATPEPASCDRRRSSS